MARIEHFVDTGTMGQNDLEIYELDKFLGWMTQVSDQNWVIISTSSIFNSYRTYSNLELHHFRACVLHYDEFGILLKN